MNPDPSTRCTSFQCESSQCESSQCESSQCEPVHGARRRSPWMRPVAAAAVTLLLAACGSSSASPSATTSATASSAQSGSGVSQASLLAQRRAAGIAACPAVPQGATASANGLPAVTLDCLGGDSRVNLAGLANGHPTIVNIWATWCGPCRTEGPLLGRLHAAQGRHASLQMVGVLYADTAQDAAIEMAKGYGMTYPMLVDAQQTLRAPLRLAGLPQTLLVDGQGHIVHRTSGGYRTYDALTADVQKYLGVQA